MYRYCLKNGMTKEYDFVKEFDFLMVNIEDSVGHPDNRHMLVLKSDGAFFCLDPEDEEYLSNLSGIKANHGVHFRWKVFGSHLLMVTYT